MQPGAIVADGVSRRFRVYPKEVVTLKELVVRRRQFRPTEIWALRDVSLAIEPGEAVAVIGRNGSGKTTLLRLIAGIFQPTSGRIAVGGSVGSLLHLGAGFHPDLTGRENVFLNGSIHGLKRSYIRRRMDEIVDFAELERFIDLPVRTYSAGMYMRLGFAIAMHLDPDVLLLDEVFAVGDEAFQRKCFGKIFEFKRRDGTIVFVSHDAAAVQRLCERAVLLHEGRIEIDGRTHDALARYQAMLAEDPDPGERAAGLREWGSGELRIAGVTLRGADGRARHEFLSGEPLTIELRVRAERAVPPPRVSLELLDLSGWLVGASACESENLGWDEAPGERVLRFESDPLPLAEGRFKVAAALTDPDGRHIYHRVEDGVHFVVYPDREGGRGAIRLDGRWNLAGARSAAEVESR